MQYGKLSIVGIFLVIAVYMVGSFAPMNSSMLRNAVSFSLTAFADDDEDEDEDDDEDDGDASQSSRSEKQTKTVMKQVVTYEMRLMNDPEFLIDTDKDGLVDGVDPDPSQDQREYFTDIDGDGVPNILDKYHDEDDFAYHDDEDVNMNGIIDSYE